MWEYRYKSLREDLVTEEPSKELCRDARLAIQKLEKENEQLRMQIILYRANIAHLQAVLANTEKILTKVREAL
jgi:vacuolar-type H+-ATPase subunit E/Vma4